MNRLAAHLIHFSSLAHSAARDFVQDEDGVTVVEIILVLVVLISLVVIFRKQLTNIVKDILDRAARDARGV